MTKAHMMVHDEGLEGYTKAHAIDFNARAPQDVMKGGIDPPSW